MQSLCRCVLQDQGQPTVPRHGHSGRMLRPYTTNVVVTGGPAAVAPNITSCDMFQSASPHVSTSSASRCNPRFASYPPPRPVFSVNTIPGASHVFPSMIINMMQHIASLKSGAFSSWCLFRGPPLQIATSISHCTISYRIVTMLALRIEQLSA